MRRIVFFCIGSLMVCNWAVAQVVATPQDKEIWEKTASQLQANNQLPLAALVLGACSPYPGAARWRKTGG
jgi:hypothetical protein